MAYGPCPKCQSREQFEKFFDDYPQYKAFELAGFLVQDSRPSFVLRCTKNEDHVWENSDAVAPELKAQGYLSYY